MILRRVIKEVKVMVMVEMKVVESIRDEFDLCAGVRLRLRLPYSHHGDKFGKHRLLAFLLHIRVDPTLKMVKSQRDMFHSLTAPSGAIVMVIKPTTILLPFSPLIPI